MHLARGKRDPFAWLIWKLPRQAAADPGRQVERKAPGRSDPTREQLLANARKIWGAANAAERAILIESYPELAEMDEHAQVAGNGD